MTGWVTEALPGSGGMVRVSVQGSDGTVARFEVGQARAGVWEVGAPVEIDVDGRMVSSKRRSGGLRLQVAATEWHSPPLDRLVAAVPVSPRLGSDVLRGRVVAVERTSAGWRVMARATLASGGCLECEFVMTVWEPMAGMRVLLAGGTPHEGPSGGFVVRFQQVGPYQEYDVGCELAAHGDYPISAPMIDDSPLPELVGEWIAGQGATVRRIDNYDRGRVWVVEVSTGRGSTHHFKFPRESWREVCENVGVDWPGTAQRWDDNGPMLVRAPTSVYTNGQKAATMADFEAAATDPWVIPAAYEDVMRDQIEDMVLRDGCVDEFRVPKDVGFTGQAWGVDVCVDVGLPRGELIVVTSSRGGGRKTHRIVGLA